MSKETKVHFRILYVKLSRWDNFRQSLITLALLCFCAWVSKDSTFWTLIVGLLFILIISSMTAVFSHENTKKFYNKTELIDWANSLPDQKETKRSGE